MLFNEPKLLKSKPSAARSARWSVSVLFNEPKLLKSGKIPKLGIDKLRFSALQRAEIAEILRQVMYILCSIFVSVLFNEPKLLK